jgi:ATP-dependent Lon protease
MVKTRSYFKKRRICEEKDDKKDDIDDNVKIVKNNKRERDVVLGRELLLENENENENESDVSQTQITEELKQSENKAGIVSDIVSDSSSTATSEATSEDTTQTPSECSQSSDYTPPKIQDIINPFFADLYKLDVEDKKSRELNDILAITNEIKADLALEKFNTEFYRKFSDIRNVIEKSIPSFSDIVNSGMTIEHKAECLEMLYALYNMSPSDPYCITYKQEINNKISLYKTEDNITAEERAFLEKEEKLLTSGRVLSTKQKILLLDAPFEIKKEIYGKYLQLMKIEKVSEEYAKLSAWIDVAISVPYKTVINNFSKELNILQPLSFSHLETYIFKVKDHLDKHFYRMDSVKEQILVFLASKFSSNSNRGKTLALLGPPGCGKTSISMELSKICGIPFSKLSCGGKKSDYFNGSLYVYIGSQPGEITKALISMKCKNGILLLDEFEKMLSSNDVVSSFLHITDSEQNHMFTDNYLGNNIQIDLSMLWIILSMNKLPSDSALKDRLFVINVPGYNSKEKIEILKNNIIPRIMESYSMKNVKVDEDVYTYMINTFTTLEESGVRSLIHATEDMFRKLQFIRTVPNCKTSFSLTYKEPFLLTREKAEKLIKADKKEESHLSMYA